MREEKQVKTGIRIERKEVEFKTVTVFTFDLIKKINTKKRNPIKMTKFSFLLVNCVSTVK